jgi:hypothetical protein
MFRLHFLLLFACATCPVAFAQEGPAKEVPELEALSHYVGEWDVVVTSPNMPNLQGEATAEWILDGRFVEQTGVLKSADGSTVLKLKTLMTYDQKTKTYRMWSFISNGTVTEAEGTWDAEKKTMTSVQRSDGAKTTTTADFSKEGTEQWRIVTTNAQNTAVSELSGTNTSRQK